MLFFGGKRQDRQVSFARGPEVREESLEGFSQVSGLIVSSLWKIRERKTSKKVKKDLKEDVSIIKAQHKSINYSYVNRKGMIMEFAN